LCPAIPDQAYYGNSSHRPRQVQPIRNAPESEVVNARRQRQPQKETTSKNVHGLPWEWTGGANRLSTGRFVSPSSH
jgi:hypothetical protein